MSAQASALDLNPSFAASATWRSRLLAILLMVAIAGVFWVDSRYPALLKRYHSGTQLKASGALTFGAVYSVDRATMPLATRVWRTTINWLDANRVGMTFSFLFGPAALTFLATLRRRRTSSRFSTRSSARLPEFLWPFAPTVSRLSLAVSTPPE